MRFIPVFIAVVLLGILAAAPGCKTAETAGGKLYFSQGLYDKAIAQLEPAVKIKPDDYEAWFWLGKSYAEVGRYADAANAFDQSAKGPKMAKEVENAREHYWVTQYNVGLGYVNEAQAATPDGAKELPSAARAKYEQALAAFESAITIDPAKPRGYIYKGFALNKLDRSADAVAAYEKAMAVAPDDPQARNNLAQTFKDLGNEGMDKKTAAGYDEAVRYYSRAAEITPDDAGLLFAMATAHFELARGDSSRAKVELAAAAEGYKKVLPLVRKDNKDDEDTLFNLTLVYVEAGDYVAAEQIARRVVDLDTKKPDGRKLLGRVYARKGDSTKAFAELLVASSLEKGSAVGLPSSWNADEKKRFGWGRDAEAVVKTKGQPDEVRVHEEAGTTIATWFYWTKGEAVAFSKGSQLAAVSFTPVN
jgi:tetratricopeptide (TPR) repeat protein